MSAAVASPVHDGRIAAHFALDASGATILGGLDTRSPLRIAPLQRRADGGADACVTECGPGMFPGDTAQLTWTLDAGARVRVTSPAHLRIHGRALDIASPGTPARISQCATIASGAMLELLPEPVVLHAGANLESTLRVDITGSGTLVAAEIVACGRVAHDETWAFRTWNAQLDIHVDGRLVAASAQLIQPGGPTGDPRALGVLGNATHWCTMHVVGALDAEQCNDLRQELATTLDLHRDVDGCVDLLVSHGLILIARSDDAWSLKRLVRNIAKLVVESHQIASA